VRSDCDWSQDGLRTIYFVPVIEADALLGHLQIESQETLFELNEQELRSLKWLATAMVCRHRFADTGAA
jgi:hypothetical protein